MPLSADFSASQSLANNNQITLTDNSTGSDATITTRRIYIRLPNGNWLNENGESTTEVYTDWSYSSSTKTLDVLDESTSCSITVNWYASSTLTYTKTEEYCFNLYDYLFALEVLQGNTSSPSQVQDAAFINNMMQFIVNIFNAENAITYGGDIYSSQEALNRNQLMIDNDNFYF